MFNKSDLFVLLAVIISFVVTGYLFFVLGDTQQAIFTAIWVPAIFSFGAYFKLCVLLGEKIE